MKHVSKILALILALMMLAAVMTACGEDSSKSDSNSADSSSSVPGSEQTWGEITVFVPDSMTMEGGDGTFDPDDPKTVWLKGKENASEYIKVIIIDSEDNAKSNLEITKDVNKEYNPVDVSVSFNDVSTWNGVSYKALGIDCTSVYSVAGDKVYYVMAGGFKENDETMMKVLESLK